MAEQRRAGVLFLKIDADLYDVKGSFTYNLGSPVRETIVGHDGVHGYKELPQAPSIEGEITDRASLDVKALTNLEDVTVTLELANGKVIALRNAWFVGEGQIQTEEANIAVRFEGLSAEEVT